MMSSLRMIYLALAIWGADHSIHRADRLDHCRSGCTAQLDRLDCDPCNNLHRRQLWPAALSVFAHATRNIKTAPLI